MKGDGDRTSETCWYTYVFYDSDGDVTVIQLEEDTCAVVTPDDGGGDPDDGENNGGGESGDGEMDVPCDQQLMPGPECDPDPSGGNPPYPGESDPCEITKSDLATTFPNSSSVVRIAILDMIGEHGAAFGINTKEEIQHFLSQAGHESGGFSTLSVTENMNYSADRLLEIFGYLFSRTDPNKANPDNYAGNPQKIANFVYSGSNASVGNGPPSSGDGWRFRGRGIFQLSGRDNYQQFTTFSQNELGLSESFIQNSSLIASDPEMTILSALWFYEEKILKEFTVDENTTVEKITSIVNGPRMNGLQDRKNKFNSIKSHFENCN